MAKWLFRTFSSETFEKTNSPNNKVSLLLKHPCQWNKSTPTFDPRCGLISNVKIEAETPTEIGVTDPFEGYLFEKHAISSDKKIMAIQIQSVLNKHIRAVCFSSMDAKDDEIVERIEEQVIKRKYGNYYMYFKLDGGTLHNLAISAAAKNSATGIASATVVTATYIYPSENRVTTYGESIFHPIHAAGGGTVLAGTFGTFGGTNRDGIATARFDKNQEESAIIALSQAIPRKYGPVYDVEDEYRLVLYMPDNNIDDVISVDFENVNNEVQFGYVDKIG